MRIITVIPIKRGISKDTLSYFTKKEVDFGSVVSIPVRKKMAHGLVTNIEEVQSIKSEIKSLPFAIKKVSQIQSRKFISNQFIEALKKIADWNAASIGSVLFSLIPNAILDSKIDLTYSEKEKPKGVFHEILLLQSEDSERYATYRSLIREEFAKSRSVFFCLPTTEDLLAARAILEKGIEKYTYVIHGSLSKKEIPNLWHKIIAENHPVLIIGTGQFLSIPRDDLGTVILDKESSRAYKIQTRPYIDIRKAAEFIAKAQNIRLVIGDTLLRSETLWEEKSGKYAELSPLKFRSLSNASSEIISMQLPQDMKKKEFSIFSDKLKDVIQKTKENNEHSFLFCARKGLFPITVCSDCGTTVLCKNCNSPVVLYGKVKQTKTEATGNLFVCHHCGERRDANELCIHCKGWRLNPMGIGVDKVVEDLKNLFPNLKIFVMDKEHVKNHKEAVKIRDNFYGSPGSVMVGTEMALTYLNQKVANTAVVSIDAYFSVPDFEMNEKVFHILLNMRSLAQNFFLIQTRQDKESLSYKIFEYAIRGNLIDFYRDEIEDRRAYDYPPFATYAKITLEGDKIQIKKQMEEIGNFLKPYQLLIFDAWNPKRMGKYTLHGIIKMERDSWVNEELLQKLRTLPQTASVRIDPLTLL